LKYSSPPIVNFTNAPLATKYNTLDKNIIHIWTYVERNQCSNDDCIFDL
jgi:hypothetical protein